jgi:small subunit ribosomal protein SAe
MSQVPPVLNLHEEDVKKMIACGVHLGSTNVDPAMLRYVWKRNENGIHVIDLRKTWEKLQLAARVIAAIENPKDVCAVSVSTASSGAAYAQRAVLKLSKYLSCRTFVGRITPGTFTNYQQQHYLEPRLLVASDPLKDHQPVLEASYVNLPVIAFCNTNVPLRGIDIVIPCNTEGKHSIALMYWFLTREVLRLRDSIPRESEWDVMVDMFVYRDPDEAEKQNLQAEQQKAALANQGPETTDHYNATHEGGADEADWGGNSGQQDWTNQTQDSSAAQPNWGTGGWGDEENF